MSEQHHTRTELLASAGVQFEDTNKVDIRGTLECGKNVYIDTNVIFKGHVILGNNIHIGANCIIEDSEIQADTYVKENTSITGAIIASHCIIGPYARIRPEVYIGDHCHIGNFVEIKSTTMGQGCKINHHSFVGDATLGNKVILAAGCITCNYNGWQTEKTIIEDHAFVGSGVLLIAPIKIGSGAFIAAGSTITKDIPSKVLAICRHKEVVYKDLPAEITTEN